MRVLSWGLIIWGVTVRGKIVEHTLRREGKGEGMKEGERKRRDGSRVDVSAGC
jgi:hypothetical protein